MWTPCIEIKYLVDHLVGNDVDISHEERIHLMEFSFIRVTYKQSTTYVNI